MDRTEEVETLKKVVFNLQFQMALKKNNQDEILELSEKAQTIQRKRFIHSSNESISTTRSNQNRLGFD